MIGQHQHPCNMRLYLSLLASFSIFLLVQSASSKKKKKKQFDTSKYANLCRGQSPLSTRRQHAVLQELLQVSGDRSLTLPEAAQHKAACWILYQDKAGSKPGSKRLAQRYALATFYFNTHGSSKWSDSKDWLTKKHECSWYGIICNYRSTIVGLDLGFNKVDGLLPRELALLKDLVEIDLHGNDLQGVLPYRCLEAWEKLQILRLHMNGFFGALPDEIRNLKSLRELYVFGNYFQGKIPSVLGELTDLVKVDIYANNFAGQIPSQLGNLKKLRELDVHDNDLTGAMPRAICDRRLQVLTADCLGRNPEVRCDCCTVCCAGLPHMKCVDAKTGQEIRLDMEKRRTQQKRT